MYAGIKPQWASEQLMPLPLIHISRAQLRYTFLNYFLFLSCKVPWHLVPMSNCYHSHTFTINWLSQNIYIRDQLHFMPAPAPWVTCNSGVEITALYKASKMAVIIEDAVNLHFHVEGKTMLSKENERRREGGCRGTKTWWEFVGWNNGCQNVGCVQSTDLPCRF